MTTKRKILVSIGIITFISYQLLNYSVIYPERYKLKLIKYNLFEICKVLDSTKFDSVKYCYLLNEVKNFKYVKNDCLIGFRFVKENVDFEHESLWSLFWDSDREWGYKGHVDSLVSMNIFLNNQNINNQLTDASLYEIFSLENNEILHDSFFNGHHGSNIGNFCLDAAIFFNIDSMVKNYNATPTSHSIHINLHDFHFFIIPREIVERYKDSSFDIKISFESKLYKHFENKERKDIIGAWKW